MNERTNTLLYKKYISHTLFLKGLMLVVCERWAGDGDRLLHRPSSTSFSSWLNRGSLRAQSPLSAADSQFGIFSNWLKAPRAPGYIIVSRSPASAVLQLIYTGASLDWRLGRGSLCYIILCGVSGAINVLGKRIGDPSSNTRREMLSFTSY